MADEATPKKPAKKLVIIDANEEPEAPKTPPTDKEVAESTDESTDEKVQVDEAVETNEAAETAEAPAETAETPEAAEIPEESGDTPPVTDEDEKAAIDEAFADAEDEAREPDDKADDEAETAPEEETETASETEPEPEATTEEEPIVEEQPKRPLSQLTNNVPRPKPVQDIAPAQAVEPEKEFADDVTAKAVDAIVASESDELLAREDAEAQAAQVVPVKKPRKGIKAFFAAWWHTPAARWGTLVGLLIVIAAICALPATRYAILNAAGVRGSATVTVLNTDNQQPLKNATVALADQSATTDQSGVVTFHKLRLGKTNLKITKRGFASVEQSKTLGWGSNPLGTISMTATGTKLIFTTKDFLSEKPVANAEAVSGEFNAQADKDGKIILAIDQNSEADIDVTIKADGYREEKLSIKSTDTAVKTVQLVAGQPDIFVSKRSGKMDVYKIDADGKNEAILVKATGSEREDMALLPQPNGDYTALVSTRLGERNKDGYLMSNLFIINNKTGDLTKLNQSERIQLVDWAGDRILFVAVTQGTSAANPNRSKLYSFQIGQPGAKEIASANYFNDVAIFKGALYYAPSSYAVPVSSIKFIKSNPDGSNSTTLLDKEVWNIFRSDYDTLQLSVQQDWYELKGGNQPTKLSVSPANPKSRTYRDSPDAKHSLWLDNRDGKGVLISYDTSAAKETTLQTQSGLQGPYRWLNNTTVVYRISDGRETADYVISTDGGTAKKLRDVTNLQTTNYFN